MLQLLTKADKKNVKKEYLFRLLNMLILAVISGLLIWIIALAPSFLFVFTEENLLEGQVEDLNNSELAQERDNLSASLRDLNHKIKILNSEENVFSDLLRDITSKQLPEIAISSMNFKNSRDQEDGVSPAEITISGTAQNREGLLTFSKSLEEIEEFEKVELPFSNFASNVDIPFNITININEL